MATRSTTKGAKGEKPVAGTVSAKKAATAKRSARNGPAASSEPKNRLPAATARALKELKAGKLNRYGDADDLFQKLEIKVSGVAAG